MEIIWRNLDILEVKDPIAFFECTHDSCRLLQLYEKYIRAVLDLTRLVLFIKKGTYWGDIKKQPKGEQGVKGTSWSVISAYPTST